MVSPCVSGMRGAQGDHTTELLLVNKYIQEARGRPGGEALAAVFEGFLLSTYQGAFSLAA